MTLREKIEALVKELRGHRQINANDAKDERESQYERALAGGAASAQTHAIRRLTEILDETRRAER